MNRSLQRASVGLIGAFVRTRLGHIQTTYAPSPRLRARSRSTQLKRAVLVLSVLGAAGIACNPQPAAWNQGINTIGPVAIGTQVMWVDTSRGRVFTIDPSNATPAVGKIVVPRGATDIVTTRNHDRLLLLTPGTPRTRTDQPAAIPPQLSVVTPADAANGIPGQHFDLGAPFDHLAISADGNTAIAHFTTDSSVGSQAVFANPNELAIIDLHPGAANPVVSRTIRSLGSAPIGVVFSPVITIGGAPRNLAVILATDYATIIDLTHPERNEITVPLQLPSGNATITPEQVLFDTSAATVYLRASGAADVFALALTAEQQTDPVKNDFVLHINQPSTGKTVLDMMLFTDGQKSYVLTANSTSDLSLIDSATGDFAIIPTAGPVDTLLPIGEPPTEAAVFSRRNPQATVTFVTLKNIGVGLGSNLSVRTLAKPVHDLVPVPGGSQLVVVHDDARTVVSILDLGPQRIDTPILGHLALTSYDFAGDNLIGVATGLNQLGVLALATLNPSSIDLEYPPIHVVAVGDHIIVDHAQPGGLATVIPNATSTRADTTVVWNFLLDGVLDESLEN